LVNNSSTFFKVDLKITISRSFWGHQPDGKKGQSRIKFKVLTV